MFVEACIPISRKVPAAQTRAVYISHFLRKACVLGLAENWKSLVMRHSISRRMMSLLVGLRISIYSDYA